MLRIGLLITALLAFGCKDTPQQRSQREATERAEARAAYVQKNDIEYQNYDRRQRISDDPSAIIWCTSSFGTTGSLFTVPVVGKLTSGGKRPYPKTGNPGPDGMYGSSGQYRFGFTPGGVYADWYNMSVFCTTMPMQWQREQTTIILGTDKELMKAQGDARAAIRAGDPERASQILRDAVRDASQPPAEIPDGAETE